MARAADAQRLGRRRRGVHDQLETAALARSEGVPGRGAFLGEGVPPLLLDGRGGVGEHPGEALAGDVGGGGRRRHRLEHLGYAPDRSGDQCERVDDAAAVGDPGGREREVPAVEAEALLTPCGQDDLHRLLEGLPVEGVGVPAHLVVAAGHHGPERPRLTGHGAPPHAEHHPTTAEDVGHGEVLGQAQRMPLGHDVEHLPEPQPLGQPRQVQAEQHQVRRELVALVLEVMLGEPHGVVAQAVGGTGPVAEVGVGRGHLLVGHPPVTRDRGARPRGRTSGRSRRNRGRPASLNSLLKRCVRRVCAVSRHHDRQLAWPGPPNQ